MNNPFRLVWGDGGSDYINLSRTCAEEIRTGKLANPEAAKVLQQEIFNFVGEVRRSIDYYVAQTQERNLTRVILSGSGSKTLNLPQEMNRGLRLPVEMGRPLQNLQLGRLAFTPEELADIESSVAVCTGLALREVLE